jgi:hypothetical protein
MRNLRFVPVVLAVLAACNGGSGAVISSHEQAAGETLKEMDRFAGILEGIKDQASAEAAKPAFEALKKDLDALIQAVDKLGEPSAEEAKKASGKLEAGIGDMGERMDMVIARLDASGVGMSIQATTGVIMGKFMTLRAKVGG